MSASKIILCGIPQGLVLGPILFVLYIADVVRLITRHGLCPHLFADDTQVYGRCPPPRMACLAEPVTACAEDVANWMQSIDLVQR